MAGVTQAKGAYFDKLKQRIEKLSRDNGGRTVAMVSFSLGSPVAALFLNSASRGARSLAGSERCGARAPCGFQTSLSCFRRGASATKHA